MLRSRANRNASFDATKASRYMINSFVTSGFDTVDAIPIMDISNDPDNSLNSIEDFINRKYPNDPKFAPTATASTLEFPLGHPRHIEVFVKEVKALEEDKRRACKRHYSNSSV